MGRQEQTPVINGYKMLKETPMVQSGKKDSVDSNFFAGKNRASGKFKMPVT